MGGSSEEEEESDEDEDEDVAPARSVTGRGKFRCNLCPERVPLGQRIANTETHMVMNEIRK